MDAEMRLHVELQTELNVKAGMDTDEARYAALRQFGNVASLQERARGISADGCGSNSSSKTCAMLRARCVGIPASPRPPFSRSHSASAPTLRFLSIVHGVLLKSLAYREPQRLVTLLHGQFPVAPADFLD